MIFLEIQKIQDEPKKTNNTSNVEDTKKLTSTSSTSKLPKFPIKKEDLPQNQVTKQPEKPKEEEDDIFSTDSKKPETNKSTNTSNTSSTTQESKIPKFPIKKEDLPQNQITKQPEKPKDEDDIFSTDSKKSEKTQTQDEDDIFGAKTQDEDDIFGDTKTQDEPKKTSNTSNVEDTKKLTSTSSTSKLPKFPIKKEDLPQNQTTKQPEKPKEDEDDIFSKESNTNTQKTKFEDELKQKAKIIQNEDKIKSETPIKNPKIEQRPPLTLVPDFVETHTPKKIMKMIYSLAKLKVI